MVKPEDWLDRYGDALFRYAFLRVSQRAIAEDLVQETFLTAWKARDRFEGRSSEKTWLTGIMRHKILDYIRKSQHDKPKYLEGASELENAFDDWEHWSSKSGLRPEQWDLDPSLLLESQEFEDVLKNCLSRLPPRTAESFLLHEVDETKPKEIAKILKVSTTNLYTLLHRARFQLRACLQRLWPIQRK